MDKMMFELRKWLFRKRKDLNTIILYASFVLIIALLALGYSTVFRPLKDKYVSQMEQIYLYNSNIAALPELSLSSEIMNKKVENIKDVYKRLSDIVPGERNVPMVTSQISLAAEHNKVIIDSMKKISETSVVLGKDNFGVVKYNLVCYGSYENIVNLLGTLETSKSIFAFEKISISPLTQDDFKKYPDASFVRIDFDVNIYMKAKV